MNKFRGLNLKLLGSVSKACVLALVALIGLLIVLTSCHYFPPKFDYGFLLGRESHFFSWYAVAFYIHVTSASFGLFVGLLQSMNWLRRKSIQFHKTAGKLYVYTVLLFAAPSGLAMSLKANGSGIAATGFALLAIGTAWTTYMGLHRVRSGDIARQKIWMTRSYLLMCSAVTLRFLAAIANEFQINLSYDAMAWLSWIPQIAIYEIARIAQNKSG